MSLLGKLRNIWLYGGSGEERKKSKTLQVIRRQQDPLDEWDITTHLGDGAFSQVFKVTLHRSWAYFGASTPEEEKGNFHLFTFKF